MLEYKLPNDSLFQVRICRSSLRLLHTVQESVQNPERTRQAMEGGGLA